jgi:hypothetical protein
MMHVFITSASAWFAGAPACTSIAHRLLASSTAPAQTLVIDLATVQRESGQAASGHALPEPVSMRSWIDHFFRDQPMLDVERVHRAAQALCVQGTKVAVIDATALDAGLIDRSMNQLRVAFYGCAHWPGVLVLVVDDAILHDVAGFAGRVFFIQPNVTGQERIRSLLGHITRFSRMEGTFGMRHKLLNSINSWLNRPRRRITVTEEK